MRKNYFSGAAGMCALLFAVLLAVDGTSQAQTLSGSTGCLGSLLAVTSSVTPTQIVWELGGSGVSTVTATIASAGVEVAGTGTVSGTGSTQLQYPYGVFVDGSGNIYVADYGNSRIQKWAAGATTGITVAGTGGHGTGANQLNSPTGVYADGSGNIYVADEGNHRIQEWAPGATTGTTVAGTGTAGSGATQLAYPFGVYVDGSGNIYVADQGNGRIQEWAPGATIGTTVAGTGGNGTGATQLDGPTGVYVDGSGNIYVADQGNIRIQEWAPGATIGTTVAGTGGYGTGATQLDGPTGVYVDGSGNIYVADYGNNRIQKWAHGATTGTTVAGTGISGTGANQLSGPIGVYVDGSGNIYVADYGNNRVQEFTASITTTYNATISGGYSALVTTTEGSVTTNTVTIDSIAPNPGVITGINTVCTGTSTNLSDTAAGGNWTIDNAAIGIMFAPGVVITSGAGTGNVSYTVTNGCGSASATTLLTVLAATSAGTINGSATVHLGSSITLTDAVTGGTWSASNTKIHVSGGVVTGVTIGSGTVSYAVSGTCGTAHATKTITVSTPLPGINGVASVCVSNTTSLTDATSGGTWSSGSTAIATINSSGIVTGFSAGTSVISYTTSSGGVGIIVTVNSTAPSPGTITGTAIVCDGSSTNLTDGAAGGVWSSGNTTVATVDGTGVVTGAASGTSTISYTATNGCGSNSASVIVTVSGYPVAITGGPVLSPSSIISTIASGFSDPVQMAIDASGNLYIADVNNHRIQMVTPGGVTTTFAGTGTSGYSGDGGPATAAQLYTPNGVAVDAAGNVYIADSHNYRIRMVDPSGNINTIAGNGSDGEDGDGGDPLDATIGSPTNITFDGSGNLVFSSANHYVRKITGGIINIIAGNGGTSYTGDGGPATSAGMYPIGVCYDAPGNLYITDVNNSVVRKVNTSGTISTVAGNGTYGYTGDGGAATSATLGNPISTILDAAGNMYIADNNNAVIRVVNTSGIISTFAGTTVGTSGDGGPASAAKFQNPVSLCFDNSGDLYCVDGQSNNLREISVGAITVCAGGSINLSDATPGGAWSNAGGNIGVNGSGDVTGITAGTAIVTYTLPAGCATTTMVTVTPGPTISASSSVAICAGSSTVLTATGGTTYSWSPSGSLSSNTGSPVTAIPTSTTTYTVTGTTGSCSNHATVSVTVNATSAGTIIGPSSVNVGSTIVLTDAISGGTWSASNANASVSGGIVTGEGGGSVIISYAVSGSCGIGYATKTIAVINTSLPGITGVARVCIGTTTNLTDATTGGVWTSNNPGAASVVSGTGVVTGVDAGTAIITYTDGGIYTTIVVTIGATPVNIVGAGISCLGGPAITISDATSGGAWSSATEAVSIAGTGTILTVTANNTGATTITYSLGACYKTLPITVNAVPTAILGTTVTCYPNTTTLSDLTSGGAWSSSNPTGVSVGATSGIVTGAYIGNYTITYTLAGCYATTPLTVALAPAGITGTTTVCGGLTTTLADGTSGGTWSSGTPAVGSFSSGSSGVMTGVSQGIVTVSYIMASGCMSTAIVTVNAVAAITGNSLLCAGTTIPLTDAMAGNWSSSKPSVATVGSTGVVTGVAGGTATISYALSNGCYATVISTVNATAAAINGASSVCQGSTMTLTDVTAGGVWSSSNSSVVTVTGGASGTVTGATTGSATISYSLSSGCAQTITIVVNPIPANAITYTATSLCAGATTTLSDLSEDGAWSSSNTIVTVNSSGLVTAGAAAGTTTVSYTISGCAVTQALTVNANPAAIAGATSECLGTIITLSDATPGGVWSSTNTNVSLAGTSTIETITTLSTGVTTIMYTLPGTGCFASLTNMVNTVPAAISGSMVACGPSVGTTMLSDANSGGTWTAVSGITIGGTTGIVTAGTYVGSYGVTYTLAGCAVTTIVTVAVAPAGITGTTTVCGGSTTTLGDGTSGGTWSSGIPAVGSFSSGASGVMTGVSQGMVTVSYIMASGCMSTAIVTVNAVAAITGNSLLCAGTTIPLTDAMAGNWSSSKPSVATVGSTGVVTGVAGGTATISYALSNGCYATVISTVNATAAAINGASSVCQGATITLTDVTAGGVWSSSNTFAATVTGGTSGTVTGVAAGTSIVSYSLSSGCAQTTTITVNLSPSNGITGAQALCANATTTLSDLSGGGVWSSSNTIVTVNSSGLVTAGAASGTTIVSYTISGCAATEGLTVNANPAVISGATSECLGTNITLSDATTGGAWSSANTNVSLAGTGTTRTVISLAAGTTTIIYTLPGTGCFSALSNTVNAIPAAISGSPVVCGPSGGTTALSDVNSGGNWTAVAGITIGASTGIVTSGTYVGNYGVTYTLAGCSVTAIVTVALAPAGITGTAIACTGLTTTLADGTSGGTWSSNTPAVGSFNSSSSGVITGVSQGTATVSYIITASGCMSTTIVTVNTVSAISGNSAICAGTTLQLTDLSSGGTWTSSNGAVATVASTGVITGVAGGTVTISYASGGCYAKIIGTVNSVPAAINGSSSVCQNTNMTLTDVTTGGIWSSNNTAIATVTGGTSGTVTGAGAGSTTISYTTTAGCMRIVSLTVNPGPGNAITYTTANLCSGNTTTVNDLTAGGAWSSSNAAVATVGSTGLVTAGTTAGIATISYTISGCPVTQAMTVNISPVAILGATSECLGINITLSDATSGGVWSSSGTIVSITGATTGTVTTHGLGTTTITYQLPTGCYAIKSNTVVSAPPPISGYPVVCYPNSTTLSDAVSGGAWSTNNGGLAITSGGVATATYVGNYTVTYTLAGCYATTPVTVALASGASVAAIHGSTSITVGTPVTLSDATVGGVWSSSSPLIVALSGSTGTVVTASESGIGTSVIGYMVTDASGCSATATVTVNASSPRVYGGGTGGATTVYAGATYNIVDMAGGIWSSSDNGIATVDEIGLVTAIKAGTASITHTITFDNGDVTANVTPVVVVTVPASLNLLPNPNRGTFIIKGTVGSVENEEVSLEVTDVLGQVIYSSKVIAISGRLNETITLNNALVNGMYILNVQSGTEKMAFHFVMEK